MRPSGRATTAACLFAPATDKTVADAAEDAPIIEDAAPAADETAPAPAEEEEARGLPTLPAHRMELVEFKFNWEQGRRGFETAALAGGCERAGLQRDHGEGQNPC